MRRFGQWLAATHGTRFELVRHFLARFFESDLVTSPGEWMKAAAGGMGVLLSACILMVPLFIKAGAWWLRQSVAAATALTLEKSGS